MREKNKKSKKGSRKVTFVINEPSPQSVDVPISTNSDEVVSEDSIRHEIHRYLDGIGENDERPSFKDIRIYLSEKFQLPKRYMKSRKGFVRMVVEDYINNDSLGNEPQLTNAEVVRIPKSKYSLTENRIIEQVIDSFIANPANNASLRQLSTETASLSKADRMVRSKLLKDLKEALPNRKAEVKTKKVPMNNLFSILWCCSHYAYVLQKSSTIGN
jgi:hypothetical protein